MIFYQSARKLAAQNCDCDSMLLWLHTHCTLTHKNGPLFNFGNAGEIMK